MGWGTSVDAEIFLSKKTFANLYALEDHIKDLQDDITDIKRRLSMLAIANPKNSIPKSDEDECDPIFYIDRVVQEELTQLMEYSVELYKCEIVKDNWDQVENEKKAKNELNED